MTTTDTRNELGITVAKDLRTVMQGKVAIAGEASYEGARQVFNGAVDRRPTLFAFCESARDVQEAVRAARAYGLPLSVRGGGHDWVGRALSHHGLVVDLSRMRQAEVDVRGRVATVAGGALAGDVIAATGPHGLAAVTGAAGTVGLAGLLTGGATALFCRDSVWRSIICSARKLYSQTARLYLWTARRIPNCFGLFAAAAATSE
jgi:FAD/FMN-containing dehydrogenase